MGAASGTDPKVFVVIWKVVRMRNANTRLKPLFGLGTVFLISTVFFNIGSNANQTVVSIANHTEHTYLNEAVRLPVQWFSETVAVQDANGREILCQLEKIQDKRHYVWVCDDFPPACEKTYFVFDRKPRETEPLAVALRDGDYFVLKNEKIKVMIPAKKEIASRGPIFRVNGFGKWIGESEWEPNDGLIGYRVDVLGDGPVFAKVKLQYEFVDNSKSTFVLTLLPQKPYVIVEERHESREKRTWMFNISKGWSPTDGMAMGWSWAERLSNEPQRPSPHPGGIVTDDPKFTPPWHDESLHQFPLKPTRRMGKTLLFLQPRWTQNCERGWFFAAADQKAMAGIIVARAGRWFFPYENLIEVRLNEKNEVQFVFPASRGGRYFLMIISPKFSEKSIKELALWDAMHPLDKLINEYILDWQDKPVGGYVPLFFYSSSVANPTDIARRFGRRLIADIRAGKFPESGRRTLALVQQYLDPDFWGFYYNGWSAGNPNFCTDLIRIPTGLCVGLKEHPLFHRFVELVRKAIEMDLVYAVTMPKGAGQECPGYLLHSLETWLDMNSACRLLGFDITEHPRIKAAISFLLKTTEPFVNGGRRILPMGDTHPPGATWDSLVGIAKQICVLEEPMGWKTEEFPGFGVIFRNHSGTEKETFLAFKSGPNRGHYHGDQLAFHYCAYGRRLAIDHMCGYAPRPDQEHMHNRLAFAPLDWEFANMDGFERLIAFKTSQFVDIAIGEVQSERIRRMPRLPEEIVWQGRYEERALEVPLTYRRTVIFIRHPERHDYFVLRDQWNGPKLRATYCLHVNAKSFTQDGNQFSFDNGLVVTCVSPPKFEVERFDWGFERKRDGQVYYREATIGLRLSTIGESGQFITVLYPDINAPQSQLINNGVRIAFPSGEDEILFIGQDVLIQRSGKALLKLAKEEINPMRDQGDVGLFRFESGYNFGPIPMWLMEQREKRYLVVAERFYQLLRGNYSE